MCTLCIPDTRCLKLCLALQVLFYQLLHFGVAVLKANSKNTRYPPCFFSVAHWTLPWRGIKASMSLQCDSWLFPGFPSRWGSTGLLTSAAPLHRPSVVSAQSGKITQTGTGAMQQHVFSRSTNYTFFVHYIAFLSFLLRCSAFQNMLPESSVFHCSYVDLMISSFPISPLCSFSFYLEHTQLCLTSFTFIRLLKWEPVAEWESGDERGALCGWMTEWLNEWRAKAVKLSVSALHTQKRTNSEM